MQRIPLLVAALLLLACAPADWEVATNSLTASPLEEVVIGDNVEKVYNCGLGGAVIYMTPQRSLASAESVQWAIGHEWEASVGAGAEFLAKLDGELGVELQGEYGKNYATSQEVGAGWQLPAQPGEWIAYTIRWSEVWAPGTILVMNGREQRPVGYRYRQAIKTEIVKKELLDCGDGAVALTPVASAPAAEPTPPPLLSRPRPRANGRWPSRGWASRRRV